MAECLKHVLVGSSDFLKFDQLKLLLRAVSSCFLRNSSATKSPVNKQAVFLQFGISSSQTIELCQQDLITYREIIKTEQL